jgi:hypothetical protein
MDLDQGEDGADGAAVEFVSGRPESGVGLEQVGFIQRWVSTSHVLLGNRTETPSQARSWLLSTRMLHLYGETGRSSLGPTSSQYPRTPGLRRVHPLPKSSTSTRRTMWNPWMFSSPPPHSRGSERTGTKPNDAYKKLPEVTTPHKAPLPPITLKRQVVARYRHAFPSERF